MPRGRQFSRIISPPFGRGHIEEGLPEEDEGAEKLQDPDAGEFPSPSRLTGRRALRCRRCEKTPLRNKEYRRQSQHDVQWESRESFLFVVLLSRDCHFFKTGVFLSFFFGQINGFSAVKALRKLKALNEVIEMPWSLTERANILERYFDEVGYWSFRCHELRCIERKCCSSMNDVPSFMRDKLELPPEAVSLADAMRDICHADMKNPKPDRIPAMWHMPLRIAFSVFVFHHLSSGNFPWDSFLADSPSGEKNCRKLYDFLCFTPFDPCAVYALYFARETPEDFNLAYDGDLRKELLARFGTDYRLKLFHDLRRSVDNFVKKDVRLWDIKSGIAYAKYTGFRYSEERSAVPVEKAAGAFFDFLEMERGLITRVVRERGDKTPESLFYMHIFPYLFDNWSGSEKESKSRRYIKHEFYPLKVPGRYHRIDVRGIDDGIYAKMGWHPEHLASTYFYDEKKWRTLGSFMREFRNPIMHPFQAETAKTAAASAWFNSDRAYGLAGFALFTSDVRY